MEPCQELASITEKHNKEIDRYFHRDAQTKNGNGHQNR
jgi:hypothetical protein